MHCFCMRVCVCVGETNRNRFFFLWFGSWTGLGVDCGSEQTWHVQLSMDQQIKQQSDDTSFGLLWLSWPLRL